MLQGLQQIDAKQGFLHVQLQQENDYDAFIYEQIRMDEECLQPLQEDKKTFRYEISGLLSLSCFLENYVFEREEGYRFLIQLLERMIKVNRNKPIVVDVRYIYLPPHGNFLRFLAVPLNITHWYLQKEETRTFVEYVAMHFQTKESYEIIGFLVRCIHGDEFSLTSVLQGLLLLKELYTDKPPFWKRLCQKHQEQDFTARSAVLMETIKTMEETEKAKNGSAVHLAKTSPLGETKEYACLEGKDQTYVLKEMIVAIGRGETCAIQLQDSSVSLQHVRLRCEQGRWYAKDLRSKNGTTLNGKQMQREMRLKEGMELQVANYRFIFHEQMIW